jgi:hypothetical protein
MQCKECIAMQLATYKRIQWFDSLECGTDFVRLFRDNTVCVCVWTGHTKFLDLDSKKAVTDKHPPTCIFGFPDQSLIIKLPNRNAINTFPFPHARHIYVSSCSRWLNSTKVTIIYQDPSLLGYDPVPTGGYRLLEKRSTTGNYLSIATASYCKRREYSRAPL